MRRPILTGSAAPATAMHRLAHSAARAAALAGGCALLAMMILTCISIAGRILNSAMHSDFMESIAPRFAAAVIDIGVGPVNGDYELVEAAMAFIIFAFLPLCQLERGHAVVDIFANRLGGKSGRILAAICETLFAAVLVLLAWQLALGLHDKWRSGETTYLLGIPIWWAYGAALAGAVIAALVAIYVAAMRWRGDDAMPAEENP